MVPASLWVLALIMNSTHVYGVPVALMKAMLLLQRSFGCAGGHCCHQWLAVHHCDDPGCCSGRHLWLHHLVYVSRQEEKEQVQVPHRTGTHPSFIAYRMPASVMLASKWAPFCLIEV